MGEFRGFGGIIAAFGGPGAFSTELGIPASHARAMKTRDSIAPAYWPLLIRKARKRGMWWVTEERLLSYYAERWPPAKRSGAA